MKKDVVVSMTDSMEATPIAHLVALANKYTSRIYLHTDSTKVNAKSIMGMMSLMLVSGSVVTIDADGEDQESAVEAIEEFLTT